jgi:hypothetical protein
LGATATSLTSHIIDSESQPTLWGPGLIQAILNARKEAGDSDNDEDDDDSDYYDDI